MFAAAIRCRGTLKCVASCQNSNKTESPIVGARKRFEAKRQQAAKEAFSKLSAIAAADVKQVTDFLVELDTLHKKELMPKKEEAVEPTNIFEESGPVDNSK